MHFLSLNLLAASPGAGEFAVETAAWLLAYLALALVVSFLCSVAEAVMLSVGRGYIDTLRQEGAKAGEILARFKERPDEPLSAILTLNTVAHTVGAAGVGHQSAMLFGEKWLGLSSAVLTLLILVGSEIIPKTLGTTYWRRLAPATAHGVRILTWMMRPLIRMLQWFTRKASARHGGAEDQSRAELESIVWRASQSVCLSEPEAAVLRNLFELSRTPVKKIMTPRVVVFSLPQSSTAGEYRLQHARNPFSRIPVHGEKPYDITGFVLKAEILAAERPEAPLEDFRREMPVVTESLPVSALYDLLVGGREHLALVVNEYGDYTGIASLEDVIETLLGREIIDELDHAADMRSEARERAGLDPAGGALPGRPGAG